MNDQEFEAYMAQMDDELILQSILQKIKDNPEHPIKIGNITIPGDKETFNKMWLAKAFDDIDPSLRLKLNPLSLMRNSLHMGRYEWSEYFFKMRENLLYRSPRQLWKDGEYYTRISIDVYNILTLTLKGNLKITRKIHSLSLNAMDEDYNDETNNITQKYLSGPPEDLMFPHDINDCENSADEIAIIYSHPFLTKIFREIVLRYQHLCNRSNEERISIYMDEINELYSKIKFIQRLMYFGVKSVIYSFKEIKYNYLDIDPTIRDINQEPNEFQDIPYKEALYKFYIYCASPEKISPAHLAKAYFLGNVVVQYEEIKRIINSYILPLSSCIRQDKLKSVCCQIILMYLKPTLITERYIISKMASIFKLL